MTRNLVSLLEDARRAVDPVLADEMLNYYLKRNAAVDDLQFRTEYKILSLQRNIKILEADAIKNSWWLGHMKHMCDFISLKLFLN